MTSELKQNFTLRITQANTTELIVILYDILLEYLKEAQEALCIQDYVLFEETLRKVRACVNELLNSLHLEYEVAASLQQIYIYCIKRLAHTSIKKDETILREVSSLISQLRDAYKEVSILNTEEPVMKNTQSLYTGLTYNKNKLTDDMTNQSSNRGLLI